MEVSMDDQSEKDRHQRTVEVSRASLSIDECTKKQLATTMDAEGLKEGIGCMPMERRRSVGRIGAEESNVCRSSE